MDLIIWILEPASSMSSSLLHQERHFLPTIGVDIETFDLTKRRQICLREVGGSFLLLWHTYLVSAHGVMFCVDSTNHSDFSLVQSEFHRLAKYLKGRIPLCVVVTKWESSHAAAPEVLMHDVLCLDWVSGVDVHWTNYVTIAWNLEEVLAWIRTTKGI